MAWEPAVSGMMHQLNSWYLNSYRFTVRNLSIDGAQIGIHAGWNWGWTFQVCYFAAYEELSR